MGKAEAKNRRFISNPSSTTFMSKSMAINNEKKDRKSSESDTAFKKSQLKRRHQMVASMMPGQE